MQLNIDGLILNDDESIDDFVDRIKVNSSYPIVYEVLYEEEIMDKLVNLDDVFKVIDKHIEYHNDMIERYKIIVANTQSVHHMEEIYSSASAIASLKMLRHELNGEVEY